MGLAMAINLQRHLSTLPHHPTLAYTNRTLSRGNGLATLGGRGFKTPAEVVTESDVVFFSVSAGCQFCCGWIFSLVAVDVYARRPGPTVVAFEGSSKIL
jgi:hypothetical protein